MIFLETIEVVNGDMWLKCEARLTGRELVCARPKMG